MPAEERARSLPHLELVKLRSGETLYRAADRLAWLYFPVDSVVATLGVNRKGGAAEYALIGKEGLIGLNALLGDRHAGASAIVLLPGQSYRLPVEPLSESFLRSHALRRVILRCTESRVFQMSLTTRCHAHHSMEQGLCRWLLQALDRAGSNELRITHELIGLVLGVRREAVSIAAMRLQARKAIHYGRGRVTEFDRGILEALTCECYAALKRDLDVMARDIAQL